MTVSTANLTSDLTPGPMTCATEDLHLLLIKLGCCHITITILIEDRSMVKENFTLERHAGST